MSNVDILKNDYEYYHGEGKKYLSNSDIGVLLSNPKMFGVEREDNKNFAEGRYFHQLLIEPDKAEQTHIVDVSTRSTKAYKEYCEANNIQFAMLKHEADNIRSLVSKMKSNIEFFDVIYDPSCVYEQPAIGDIEGMVWKGKADIVHKDFVVDLKTTSDIRKFRYSARAYNYDSQAYIYQALFGKPLAFYVIDKETGVLGIYHTSDEFLESGKLKVKEAINVYNKYFSKNATDNVENYCINETLY